MKKKRLRINLRRKLMNICKLTSSGGNQDA
ncbi:hypothetical protein DFM95_002431 [Clostridium beijerinckii]|nr:hypothetical protein [Clostridium beijerinckii]NRT94063.1 hypothetical protein [Clostridium beijerinckii]NRU00097.1 hypothetical protein [Clostridium beijerinckii]NRU10739.1 hypothetical protein [Clostridium beijerinckii]NRV18964.1 hypothetical protein [Clostridium beijerinckii]